MGMKKTILKELLSFALAFLLVLLFCLLGIGIFIGALAFPVTFENIAESEEYKQGVLQSVENMLQFSATDTGIPYELLKEYVDDDMVLELAKSSASEFPLLLFGDINNYSQSYNEQALQQAIGEYYFEQTGNSPSGNMALTEVSASIKAAVESAVRIPNVVSFGWVGILRFMPIIILVAVVGIVLLMFGLAKTVGKENKNMWYFGVFLSSGIALLIPFILVFTMGMYNLSIRPEQLKLMIENVVSVFHCVCGAMSFALIGISGVIYIKRLRKMDN